MTSTGKQLFTTLESDGTLTVEIAQSEFPDPNGNQVLVKMEAAPINPSDLAILTGAADFEKNNSLSFWGGARVCSSPCCREDTF